MSYLSDLKEIIIDAAEALVINSGAAHLTLDAVAHKAGVSKGGLLYHFPTKESLLHTMLDRHIKRFEDAKEKKLKKLPEEPSREIKAYIISALTQNRKAKRISSALLAAVAFDPKLLKPVKKIYRKNIEKFISSELGFEQAAIITLATDGLRLLEILNLSPFNKRERKRIIEILLNLAEVTPKIKKEKNLLKL